MKNQLKYHMLLLVCSFGIFAGCSADFLNQEPEASLLNANFWKTESDLKQGVVGAYRSVRDMGQGQSSYWLFGEMRSDNTTFQYNEAQRGQENREFIDLFMATPDNTLLRDFWQASYSGIARCNDVLDNSERIPMSDESRNQSEGEVKFLRAFHYFNLVRQFGGVPLRLNVTTSPNEAKSTGRASIEDVYQQIIVDLTQAVEQLPTIDVIPSSERGRVTKGSAYALLGKVYLTLSRHDDALAALRNISGYQLMSVYADIFKPENKNNIESIFEIQYLGAINTLSSNFMYWFAPFNSGNVVTQDPGVNLNFNSGWNIPTDDLIAAYEAGDLRKDASLKEGFYLNGTWITVPYVSKYNHGFVQPGQTDVNFPVIRYADVMLMIAECLNEQGFAADGEAFTLLNAVRSRAGLPAKTANNANPALRLTTQEGFRAAIFQERRIELAFENHRWYDLVRSGNAVAVMNVHGQEENAKNPQYPSGAYSVTENRLLLPIPEREVMLDDLPQNPQ